MKRVYSMVVILFLLTMLSFTFLFSAYAFPVQSVGAESESEGAYYIDIPLKDIAVFGFQYLKGEDMPFKFLAKRDYTLTVRVNFEDIDVGISFPCDITAWGGASNLVKEIGSWFGKYKYAFGFFKDNVRVRVSMAVYNCLLENSSSSQTLGFLINGASIPIYSVNKVLLKQSDKFNLKYELSNQGGAGFVDIREEYSIVDPIVHPENKITSLSDFWFWLKDILLGPGSFLKIVLWVAIILVAVFLTGTVYKLVRR